MTEAKLVIAWPHATLPPPATTNRNVMTKLSEPEKLEIVRLLAHFNTPAEVVVAMREHHGVEVDRFQVRAYDPTNARYEAGDKWRAIFDAERSKYLHDIDGIPIANKAFRLNELGKNYFRAQRSGNIVLANATLAQAAKEARGVSNMRSQIEMQPKSSSSDELSPEEMRNEARNIVDAMLGRARDRGVLPEPKKSLAA